ncbi:hypothetical protein ES703_36412 [subsurface metagenome]
MIDWWIVLISALSSLITAVVVAIITVRLSVRQFYSQRWWEKKSEAYSDISKDLSRLFFCIGELYAEAVGEKKLNKHRYETLNNEFLRRLESFKMIVAGGAFIVSEEVYKEIEVLIERLSNNRYMQDKEPFWDYLGRDYEAIKKFKDTFNKLAKADLNVNEIRYQVRKIFSKLRFKKSTKKGV